MPYITKTDKDWLTKGEHPVAPGTLNYAITMLLIQYVQDQPKVTYAVVAEALSACTEAAAEFRRRVLVPLEEVKRAKNGDVFPSSLIRKATGLQ